MASDLSIYIKGVVELDISEINKNVAKIANLIERQGGVRIPVKVDTKEATSEITAFRNVFEKTTSRLGGLVGQIKVGDINTSGITNAIKEIEGLGRSTLQFSNIVDIGGESFQRVNAFAKDSAGIFKQTAFHINKTTGEIYAMDRGLKTKGDTLTKIIGKVTRWAIGTSLVYLPIRQMQQSIQVMREMDTQLTALARVTDITQISFQRLGLEALETGSRFGRSVSDVLQAQVSFARAGFDNFQQMAELSLMIQTAGQMSEQVATSYIIASNAAFGFAGNVERLTALLDSQNNISNNHAVTLTFLADATRTVGNIMREAGETTQTMSAALTAVGAATQRSGSEIGRAYTNRSFNVNPIAQGCTA